MSKRLVLISLFVNLHFFIFTSEVIYPIGNPERPELTGDKSYLPFSIGVGEVLNESISPFPFRVVSFPITISQNDKEFSRGIYFDRFVVIPSIMEPTVKTPESSYDYKVRNENIIGFKFKIPLSESVADKLLLYIGPYSNFDWKLEYFAGISNVGVQPYFNLNLGGAADLIYKWDDYLKFGFSLESSIIGLDLGRRTYNSEYEPDFNFIHFGNYLDLDIDIFYEVDLTRSESIRVFYSHDVQSIYDSSYSFIQGENKIGISYNRRLFR